MKTNNLIMAIDLLWVKHNKVAGVEVYIRNIIDGIIKTQEDYKIFLLVSKDNIQSFELYKSDTIELVECDVYSENVIGRILWQNLYLGKLLTKLNVRLCFEPHNYIPLFGVSNIKFITTIHDLQLLHFPHYFSLKKRIWFRLNWLNTIKKSDKIIVISNFVKDDLISMFPNAKDKTEVIYNPIHIDTDMCASIDMIKDKYNVKSESYYYTVCSMFPHKNLKTIVKAILHIKREHINLPNKLIVSGIGKNDSNGKEFLDMLKQLDLENEIIVSGYVSDAMRNGLYKYCKAFLFPSIFEGFGIPPLEAAMFNRPVITTKETCIPEVTQNCLNYINNPFDEKEWVEVMKTCKDNKPIDYSKYSIDYAAKKYLEIFKNAFNKLESN